MQPLYKVPKKVMVEVLGKNLTDTHVATINELNDWEVEDIFIQHDDSRMVITGTKGERIILNAVH
jgi:hypothetical protein